MTALDRTDRARGALVGLAVGDALGAAVEFRRPGSFPPVTGFRSGGPHGLGPGEWTDDTSMALALADSIRKVGWDLGDQVRRYVAWYRTGEYSVTGTCFDIGVGTRQALQNFERHGDPLTSGPAAETSAGNGSIMRLAPVAIAHAGRDAGVVAARSAASSHPTHRAPQSVAACAWMGSVVAALIEGTDRGVVLDPEWSGAGTARSAASDPRIDHVIDGSYLGAAPPGINGGGYVVDCLEAALWAFHEADSFEEAVLAAVNLGDDSDTTGAVCGQFAGAWFGWSAIPEAWRTELAWHDEIVAYADDLLQAGGSMDHGHRR